MSDDVDLSRFGINRNACGSAVSHAYELRGVFGRIDAQLNLMGAHFPVYVENVDTVLSWQKILQPNSWEGTQYGFYVSRSRPELAPQVENISRSYPVDYSATLLAAPLLVDFLARMSEHMHAVGIACEKFKLNKGTP